MTFRCCDEREPEEGKVSCYAPLIRSGRGMPLFLLLARLLQSAIRIARTRVQLTQCQVALIIRLQNGHPLNVRASHS